MNEGAGLHFVFFLSLFLCFYLLFSSLSLFVSLSFLQLYEEYRHSGFFGCDRKCPPFLIFFKKKSFFCYFPFSEMEEEERNNNAGGHTHVETVENDEENDNISIDSGEFDPAKKYSNLFVFSGGNKAGMQEMDKEKQAKVIYEMSKDSAYFKRAMKLDEEATARAKKLQVSFDQVKGSLAIRLQSIVNQKYLELEKRRSFERICCVLDMDMFFAAVEIRDQPHLKDLPVAVGGMGMISTSNYVARKYGVRAAMPGFIAKKLCPNLVLVKTNFSKYEIVSNQMKSIIREYDPNMSSYSLDEVYFDLLEAARRRYEEDLRKSRGEKTGDSTEKESVCTSERMMMNSGEKEQWERNEKEKGKAKAMGEEEEIEYQSGNEDEGALNKNNNHSSSHPLSLPSPPIERLRAIAAEILQEIRQRIKTASGGLTCSAGMANNFLLAKICADINKPDGQYELPARREAVLSFIEKLPPRKVSGVGKVMEKILTHLNILTVGDIREQFAAQIIHSFTPVTSDFLLRVSLGIGTEEMERTDENNNNNNQKKKRPDRKSVGCERTYSARGIHQRHELYLKLEELAIRVSRDIERDDDGTILGGKTITLKIKDIDFTLHTKAVTWDNGRLIRKKEDIFRLAKELLDSFLPMKVRLLGIQLSKLSFSSSSSSSSTSSSCYNESSGNTTNNNKKSVADFFRSSDANHQYNNNQSQLGLGLGLGLGEQHPAEFCDQEMKSKKNNVSDEEYQEEWQRMRKVEHKQKGKEKEEEKRKTTFTEVIDLLDDDEEDQGEEEDQDQECFLYCKEEENDGNKENKDSSEENREMESPGGNDRGHSHYDDNDDNCLDGKINSFPDNNNDNNNNNNNDEDDEEEEEDNDHDDHQEESREDELPIDTTHNDNPPSQMICPVCNETVAGNSLADLNDHLDDCLTRSSLKQQPQEREELNSSSSFSSNQKNNNNKRKTSSFPQPSETNQLIGNNTRRKKLKKTMINSTNTNRNSSHNNSNINNNNNNNNTSRHPRDRGAEILRYFK
jgi:DNA polymerase kappa